MSTERSITPERKGLFPAFLRLVIVVGLMSGCFTFVAITIAAETNPKVESEVVNQLLHIVDIDKNLTFVAGDPVGEYTASRKENLIVEVTEDDSSLIREFIAYPRAFLFGVDSDDLGLASLRIDTTPFFNIQDISYNHKSDTWFAVVNNSVMTLGQTIGKEERIPGLLIQKGDQPLLLPLDQAEGMVVSLELISDNGNHLVLSINQVITGIVGETEQHSDPNRLDSGTYILNISDIQRSLISAGLNRGLNDHGEYLETVAVTDQGKQRMVRMKYLTLSTIIFNVTEYDPTSQQEKVIFTRQPEEGYQQFRYFMSQNGQFFVTQDYDQQLTYEAPSIVKVYDLQLPSQTESDSLVEEVILPVGVMLSGVSDFGEAITQ